MTKLNAVKCKCENPTLIVKEKKNASSQWIKTHGEGSRAESTNIPHWGVLMEGKGSRSCFQHDYKLLSLLNAEML